MFAVSFIGGGGGGAAKKLKSAVAYVSLVMPKSNKYCQIWNLNIKLKFQS